MPNATGSGSGVIAEPPVAKATGPSPLGRYIVRTAWFVLVASYFLMIYAGRGLRTLALAMVGASAAIQAAVALVVYFRKHLSGQHLGEG
jgi:hypothetical protein